MSGDGELVPVLEPAEVPRAAGCPRAGRPRSRNPKVVAASGIACSCGQHLDGGVLQFAAASRAVRRRTSCRRRCRASRRAARSPSTWSIRKNGVPSTSPVGSIQRTAGHRHVGELGRPAAAPRTGGPSDRRGTPGRPARSARPGPPTSARRARRPGPPAGQDDGLRGHPVGVDAALDRHLRGDARRASPSTATATAQRAWCWCPGPSVAGASRRCRRSVRWSRVEVAIQVSKCLQTATGAACRKLSDGRSHSAAGDVAAEPLGQPHRQRSREPSASRRRR